MTNIVFGAKVGEGVLSPANIAKGSTVEVYNIDDSIGGKCTVTGDGRISFDGTMDQWNDIWSDKLFAHSIVVMVGPPKVIVADYRFYAELQIDEYTPRFIIQE